MHKTIKSVYTIVNKETMTHIQILCEFYYGVPISKSLTIEYTIYVDVDKHLRWSKLRSGEGNAKVKDREPVTTQEFVALLKKSGLINKENVENPLHKQL